MIAILVGLLVANITVLLFFYFFFLIIFKFLFFPIPVLKEITKLRLALAIATSAPITVANEVIQMLLLAANKISTVSSA